MDRSDTDQLRRGVIRISAVFLASVLAFISAPLLAADIQVPTTPTNLAVIIALSTQLNISWNASTDNVAV